MIRSDIQFRMGINIKRLLWFLHRVRNDRETFRLFGYTVLCGLTLVMILVQAAMSHSLALLAMGFHFMHHTLSLAVMISANMISTHKPTKGFSYGYKRFDVIANYAIGVLLIFSCFSVCMEAIHRMFHTDTVDSSWIPFTCIAAIFEMSFGVYKYKDNTVHYAIKRRQKYMWKKVLAETAPCWLVLLCALAMVSTEDQRIDMATACLVAVVCIKQVLPSMQQSSAILLQKAPELIMPTLDKAMKEASTVEGVLECSNEHFWTLSEGVIVGSMKVCVKNDAVEQNVLRGVRKFFEPLLTHLTIQVEKDDWDIEHHMQRVHDQWRSPRGHDDHHAHDSGHAHGHGHGHGHEHGHGHGDGHGHGHGDGHGHGHGHGDGHGHAHGHGHGDEHGHGDGHGHGHGDGHGHGHRHGHAILGDYTFSHVDDPHAQNQDCTPYTPDASPGHIHGDGYETTHQRGHGHAHGHGHATSNAHAHDHVYDHGPGHVSSVTPRHVCDSGPHGPSGHSLGFGPGQSSPIDPAHAAPFQGQGHAYGYDFTQGHEHGHSPMFAEAQHTPTS